MSIMKGRSPMLRRRLREEEKGAFVIMALVVLSLLLFIGALVVDILIVERVRATLQRTADAAALSGKIYLDKETTADAGTKDEWRLAKRAILASLRDNAVTFSGSDIRTPDLLPRGLGDEDLHEEGESVYRFAQFEFSNCRITIERGLWWYDEAEAPRGAFSSLESTSGKCPADLPAPARARCMPDAENYTAANAARVTIALRKAPVVLARAAFGIQSLNNIERQATAGPR